MSNDIGSMINGAFRANIPTVDDVLAGFKSGGWSDMNTSPAAKVLAEKAEGPDVELKRCYVRVYATDDGRRVIDDLVANSLQRAPGYLNGASPVTMDQQIAFMLERQGQNGLMTYILRMIFEGHKLLSAGSVRARKLPAPESAPSRKSSARKTTSRKKK